MVWSCYTGCCACGLLCLLVLYCTRFSVVKACCSTDRLAQGVMTAVIPKCWLCDCEVKDEANRPVLTCYRVW